MKNLSIKVAIVIPNHKENLDDLEKISLAQVRKVLKNYPIIFAGPEGKNFSYLEPGDPVVHFPKEYFQTLRGYNLLSMSSLFYEPFLSFDYILIYQLDAFVFYDALGDFCQLGYDYIGAAWPYHAWQGLKLKKTPRVGNGGFCLRKVKSCYKLTSKVSSFSNWKNVREIFDEDAFFATCGVSDGVDFNIAPVEIANYFAMEFYPDRHVKKLGYKLPFGCHHWNKIGADFYVKLFTKFGYDLSPFRNMLGNLDEVSLPIHLTKVAMDRLIRRVEQGQTISKYLPTKRFSSVRVIKSLDAMKILARLIVEENSLTDKIFIYDEKDFKDLIDDVTRENLPHLVIVSDYDKSLIEAIKSKGLMYGEHVISFQREYIKSQEKLFHNLGR